MAIVNICTLIHFKLRQILFEKNYDKNRMLRKLKVQLISSIKGFQKPRVRRTIRICKETNLKRNFSTNSLKK